MTTPADAAREGARSPDGKFGSYRLGESDDVDLSETGPNGDVDSRRVHEILSLSHDMIGIEADVRTDSTGDVMVKISGPRMREDADVAEAVLVEKGLRVRRLSMSSMYLGGFPGEVPAQDWSPEIVKKHDDVKQILDDRGVEADLRANKRSIFVVGRGDPETGGYGANTDRAVEALADQGLGGYRTGHGTFEVEFPHAAAQRPGATPHTDRP